MTPFGEEKEPRFWLPFTRAEIEKFRDLILVTGWKAFDEQLKLADNKLRCHDLLVNWPLRPNGPYARAMRVETQRKLMDDIEIELED